MTLTAPAFLCGIIFLLFGFTQIPPTTEVEILLFLNFALLFYKRKIYYLTFFFLLGFSYTIFFIHLKTTWTLPHALEGKATVIQGKIVSIPEVTPEATIFLFQYHNALLRLHWKTENTLKIGDEWQFPVRLKRIHGLQNPGGFDYDAWAFSEGIRATGYVTKGDAKKISEQHFSIQFLRQKIYDQILKILPESPTSPWIIALALGERHHISAENWQILRNTGTNHLMAIAGLHVGFMSAFIYALIQFIWRRAGRLSLWIPSQLAGGFFAMCMVILYSALAGFSTPTERASLMFIICMSIVMLRRKINIWQIYNLALFFVLVLNPLKILSVSFWLSFLSVAFIIYGMKGRLNSKGLWWKHGRIQWLLAISLIPVSICLFQECSIISLIANSIAIPWMGFFILPFIFLGIFFLLFSTKMSFLFLMIADHSLQYLWHVLTYLSQISWGTWQHAFDYPVIFLLTFAGILILLLPSGCKERWFGVVWILPLFFYQPEKPKLGEFWFTLLDVGQGLSAVIETKSHVLIFDTGPKFSANYDMGESVVLPFLRTRHISKIDMLVI
ncbi:MAG TPA: DNA internalization-related competence protein ComEC/Rec2, partial [Gammaproteobacteria bacterium]|nr:DNA internalization-related competence protein ComEC/Rec2 [Gammaproteobacteria bacterium]